VKDRYRVGIVGMGFGHKVHAPAFHAHDRFELVAVAGARPGTAARVAGQAGARAYETWQALVDEADVDVVSIATAPHMHAPVALRALERGRHILLEKPTAFDAREAGQILEAARLAGRLGAICHEFRFAPGRLAVKDELRAGAVGRILAVHATIHSPGLAGMSRAEVGWLARAETAGGMLGATASHYIDGVSWLVGEEIVRVWADLRAVAAHRPAAGGGSERVSAEDSYVVFLQFASGAIATITFSLAGGGFGETWDVLGDAGAVRLDGQGQVHVAQAGAQPRAVEVGTLPPPPALPGADPDVRTPPFMKLLDRFAAALDGDAQASADLPDLAQGLRVQRVLDGARLASATGGAVRILP